MIKWIALFFFIWIIIGYFYNHLTEEPEDE